LLGDPTNAKNKLGWIPEITAQEMCAEMVKADLTLAKRTQFLKENGYNIPLSSEA
jgi:GDPmannose 4,6-dehydratase